MTGPRAVRAVGRVTAVVMATAIAVAWMAAIAHASCAAPPPHEDQYEQTELVFVGSVVATTNDDFWAEVRVEEVWKGPDLPPQVEVWGSDSHPGAVQGRTSVDRAYATGTRYLFFIRQVDGPPYRDNQCSPTTEYDPATHDRHRPGDARPPRTDATASPSAPTETPTPVSPVDGPDADSDADETGVLAVSIEGGRPEIVPLAAAGVALAIAAWGLVWASKR